MANGLHGKNLAQSKTLCTWGSSLRGTWEVSFVPGLVPGRLGKGKCRTPNMHADEKSDEAVVLRKHRTKEGHFRRRPWREGPSPEGNSRQAAVVRTLSRAATSIRLAAVRRSACGSKPYVPPTFDPREEILCRCGGRGDTGSV